MRQTALELAADEIELGWLNDPALPRRRQAGDAGQARRATGKTIARYESEPTTNEGKKELMARARDHERLRDHALKQDPYFDYAEALLQIAIVLISVVDHRQPRVAGVSRRRGRRRRRAADHQRLLPAGGDPGAGVNRACRGVVPASRRPASGRGRGRSCGTACALVATVAQPPRMLGRIRTVSLMARSVRLRCADNVRRLVSFQATVGYGCRTVKAAGSARAHDRPCHPFKTCCPRRECSAPRRTPCNAPRRDRGAAARRSGSGSAPWRAAAARAPG